MSATVAYETPYPTGTSGPRWDAAGALRWAARAWFVVVVVGQLLFAVSVAAFYGGAAGRGDFDAWNRTMTHGHVPGEPVGNAMVAVHLVSAVIIILGGALQLLPWVRRRAPRFHRWNGRLYLVAAFAAAGAGLYMIWARGTVGDLSTYLGQSLDAVLIMLFAIVALRHALARNFRAHGRWAMRLYLVVSASLFIRAAAFLIIPLGIDAASGTGPFFTVLAFAQYLVPLGVLELYWRARESAGARTRVAMAAFLAGLTLFLGIGVGSATAGIFLPSLQRAWENRASITEPLESTLAAAGSDAAVLRYHDLRAADPTGYDFAEDELNRLGYKLLHAGKFDQAIRIFRLNIEAYPESGNVYDSLGEAYMDAGDKARAVENYQASLRLTPENGNAVRMLRRLEAP